MPKRICIIGAGPSGLSMLHMFDKMVKNGEEIPELVCYEKQTVIAGMWNYSWRTGTDENGETCPNSQYHNLWSNGPKEGLEYADYTFDEHFGKPIGSFPTRPVLLDYLKGRANKGSLLGCIKFRHAVKRVVYNDDTDDFTVDVHDYEKDQLMENLKFSHVIVCSSHFHTPNVPKDYPELEEFPGRVMHSHEMRDMREFKGKRLLVIGSSYSAEDMALQGYKFGVQSVTISYRTKPMGLKWPKEIEERPLIVKIEGNRFTFKDGSSGEYDVVIMATGYLYSYPFLADNLRLNSTNNVYPPNLYKGALWLPAAKNKLFYIGTQDLYYSFTLLDAQALFVRDVIVGKVTLPSQEAMWEDLNKWVERRKNVKDAFDDIQLQTDHLLDLNQITGYPYNCDASQRFFDWEHSKARDIMTYRNQQYTSIFTGTLAAPKNYFEEFDDSVDGWCN